MWLVTVEIVFHRFKKHKSMVYTVYTKKHVSWILRHHLLGPHSRILDGSIETQPVHASPFRT